MRLIFRLFILLLLALIAWNYFLGDETERADSEQVVESAKQLGSSLISLIASEKERFSEGKYDDIRQKLEESVVLFRSKSSELNISDEEMEDLEKENSELDSLIKRLQDSNGVEGDDLSRQIESKLSDLIKRMERLVE